MIGPKCSGKTTLGNQLAERANMHPINFSKFVKENDLKGQGDEV